MVERPLPELLRQASAVLAREIGRVPTTFLAGMDPRLVERVGMADAGAVSGSRPGTDQECPLTGATIPSAGGFDELRRQAHELIATLLNSAPSAMPGNAAPSPALLRGSESVQGTPLYDQAFAGQRCPVTHAGVPTFAVQRDSLRRQAHQLIETLLVTFNEATGEKGLPTENQVPLLSCEAPVQPGDTGRARVTIANEENTETDVALYSTNFVADHGHEVPSLRVTILPRAVTIPSQGSMDFEISIAVPEQTPKGSYAGLIQAMGSRYFKAVLSMDVL